jgi:hypothetical protein
MPRHNYPIRRGWQHGKAGKLKQQEWGIVVRKNDGEILYYCLPTGSQGPERWSYRENEALRFGSQAAAYSLSQTFATNAVALDYRVVPLTPLKA